MSDSIQRPRAVVLLSGGMDSTTLLYLLKDQGYDCIGLSVIYGQRHQIEVDYARVSCNRTGSDHTVVDLSGIRNMIGSSSLTSNLPVPEGHYAAENMKQTVVPNRNAFLLALAYGVAISRLAVKVATAVHAGDHAIYPDCRPEFIKAFEEMERVAITREIYGLPAPDLYAPFLMMSKAQIVKTGSDLHVPFQDTWSCYNGGERSRTAGYQCGRCGTCVERIGAFNEAGVFDPTTYFDKNYAIEVLKSKGEWKEHPEHSLR